MVYIQDAIARVRQILIAQWDPIGVGDVAEAQDEYDRYAAEIAAAIGNNAAAEEIASHLLNIEVERMGLKGRPARARRVARLLLAQ